MGSADFDFDFETGIQTTAEVAELDIAESEEDDEEEDEGEERVEETGSGGVSK